MNKNEGSPSAAPGRKKRHFIVWVLLIAFAIFALGSILGTVFVAPVSMLLSDAGPSVLFLLQYLVFIGIDILIVVYCALFDKEIFRSFLSARRGGMRGNTGRHFALGLLIGFVMNGACILAAWLHGDLDFSVGAFQLVYLFAALVFVCVQSGAEELICRGYILGALRERYPLWVAIAANALGFAAAHLTNPGITVLAFLEIVLIGAAFSLLVCCLDSLWMAIAVHTAWNFTQNFLFGLPNSGIVSQGSFLHLEAAKGSIFYDPVFGVEGAVTALIVSAALGVWAVACGKKHAGKQ